MAIAIYLVIILLFAIYSYSQIDLNLTLFSSSFYQTFQNQLIYLGYFNRPLSAGIYFVILLLLFLFYLLILFLINKNKISFQKIIWSIILSTTVLLFAYPAFSHDIFNYLFDARIVTKYGGNPYYHKALDFPSDQWTRFMHWTHRTYPYGPAWLFITLPFSYLGFGKFVLSLLNFKLMFSLFHLGNLYLIYQILKKSSPKKALFGLAFYAFNPLIIIESLLSPHNEVMMLFFLLLSLYLFLVKKSFILGIISLLFSAGIKFITAVLLPLFLFLQFFQEKYNYILWFKILIIFLFFPLIILIIMREPYPWYFIPFVGIGALIPQAKKLLYLIGAISLGLLLRYVPYLQHGDYSPIVIFWQNLLFLFPISIVLTWIGIEEIRRRLIH